MFEPKNEQGTIAVFCSQLHISGWNIVSIGSSFPDAILERDGEEWRVEFEYKARNFVSHAHDFKECDLIICWENDFPESLLPVIELRDPEWVNFGIKKGNPLLAQIEYWKRRAEKSELELKKYIGNPSRHNKPTRLRADGRRDTLLEILQALHGVDVEDVNKSEIARKLNVSRPTLQNDLDALQEDGRLVLNGHVVVKR